MAKKSAKPKSEGGQPDNTNAVTHGLKASGVPKGAAWVLTLIAMFRNQIESGVIAIKGSLGPMDDALTQSAVRWERHALLASRWLREEFAGLTIDQRLSLSREIARASDNRDRCLRELGLSAPPEEFSGLGGLLKGLDDAAGDGTSPASPPAQSQVASYDPMKSAFRIETAHESMLGLPGEPPAPVGPPS